MLTVAQTGRGRVTRWPLHLLASHFVAVVATVPLFAGEVLVVSDSTTDSLNIPIVLSGNTNEVPHPTIAGAGYRPAASSSFHDVTIIRNDFQVTDPVVFAAEGTNPTLAGLNLELDSLDPFCAVFWSATGPHEPNTFDGGVGADGGVHADPAVFASLTAYVEGGGWVFVTGHDALTDPDDPLLLEFVGGGAAGEAIDPSVAPGAVSSTPTFLSTGRTDIRSLTPGATTQAGISQTSRVQDLDHVSSLDGVTIGVVPELSVLGFQWTVRVPSGLVDLTDPTVGQIAYVAAGVVLFENLPFAPGEFLSDGEDKSWRTDPVYNAALLNFAYGACDAIDPQPIFRDDFESGDTTRWSSTSP